jgi:hypothetical protein
MCKPIPAGGDVRPPNCRNWLEDHGKAHPKSGCEVEGCRGALGMCLGMTPDLCTGSDATPLSNGYPPSGTGSHMTMGIIYRCVDCHQYHVPDTHCREYGYYDAEAATADTLRHFQISTLGRTGGGVIGLHDEVPKREHYHTELIKRTILDAHLRITKGLGMAQAARLAADEIITLFDPTHKKMEPFCNCPTGSHDDAYDPGGPMSGMPRPLCLIHNPDPRKR